MRIPRIYHPDPLIVDETISLTADATNHLVNVLRLKPGHPIVLFNGDGNEYSGQIVTASKRDASALVDAVLEISVESPLQLHLAQGVSRGDKMDFVIQKAVELGVQEITPLLTERCGVKLSGERWAKKHQQWQKVVISACEQCGRNTLPVLHPVTDIQAFLSTSTEQMRLTLHPHSEKRFSHLTLPPKGVRLVIGPEGGLSEAEVYGMEQVGFVTVRMGPRVLRTETAALAALTALQAGFGDF